MPDTTNNRETVYHYAVGGQDDPRFHFIVAIEPNSKVLDIGCACGDLGVSLQLVRGKMPLYGVEYNAGSIDIALQTGTYEKIWQFDLNTLDMQKFAEHVGSFDYIVWGDVLEHILYPQEVLKNFLSLLKPTGKYLLSIPNIAHASIKANLLLNNFDYTDTGLLDKTHIKFFTYKTIITFLSAINLKIEWCKFTATDALGFQSTDPYPELPLLTKGLMFKDCHSFVVQYVMQVVHSDEAQEQLNQWNAKQLILTKQNAPPSVKHMQMLALKTMI